MKIKLFPRMLMFASPYVILLFAAVWAGKAQAGSPNFRTPNPSPFSARCGEQKLEATTRNGTGFCLPEKVSFLMDCTTYTNGADALLTCLPINTQRPF